MATYDMTTLDTGARVPIKIHIINAKRSINELKTVKIATDFSVAECKFAIADQLSVQEQHQQKLVLQNCRTNDTQDAMDVELSDEDMKLSKYNISKDTVIKLYLSDTSHWSSQSITIDLTSTKRALKNKSVNNAESTATAPRIAAQTRNTETDQTIHFLTKHSKIQCRILLIAFEVTLVLLVVYWGTMSMITYCLNMIFVLVGWRGCRKLKPFFIICFLLYMVFDLIIIFLFIILGFVGQHESVYGSHAAYMILLFIEFALNIVWFYFYARFFYAVLRISEAIRVRARSITSKQPILI